MDLIHEIEWTASPLGHAALGLFGGFKIPYHVLLESRMLHNFGSGKRHIYNAAFLIYTVPKAEFEVLQGCFQP